MAPLSGFRCIACGRSTPLEGVRYACEACGGLLEVVHDLDRLRALRPAAEWRALFDARLGARDGVHRSGVWRYHELVLPDLPEADVVTMPEGNTNLYRVPALQAATGSADVRVKHEGENPTLSFKDRGMTVGVSFARHLGVRAVGCASTGDTSAAMAAYAARVPGLKAVVVLPRGKVSLEQLSQPIASGGTTLSVPADFDTCLRLLREVCARTPLYLLNSVNPLRVEGQKAIAYEIVQQLGWRAPDWIVVPVGNAGNIAALGKGLLDLEALGLIGGLPRLLGVQVEAAAPLARACRDGYRERVRVTAGETAATAIRIGDPVSYDKAVSVVRRTGGLFESVSEQEMLDAKAMVDAAGVYICPNSATAAAGFLKARARGVIAPGEQVVIVATAHGCKFSQTTIGYHTGGLAGIAPRRANRVREVEADAAAIARVVEAT